MNEKMFELTKKRTDALRRRLEVKELDAAFICFGPNVRYLSGFAGTWGDASLLITRYGSYILTDSRYTIQAGEQCPYYELKGVSAFDYKTLRELVLSDRARHIGFEDLTVSYSTFCAVKDALAGFPLTGIGDSVEMLRNIKDESELEDIHKACVIACRGLAQTVPYIRPGVKELDVATELEYRMKKLGASGKSFDTIVASGVRGALPHGLASEKVIREGEMVTIDFGCLYNGYCSDMTRTFSVGEPSAKMRAIYDTVLDAQLTAIDAYRPGMSAVELDAVARDLIADAGYGEYFGHGLGHGVGIEIHEGVRLNPRSEFMLPEDTVFSIEPGIYVEGLGGVRIEDLITCHNGVKTVLSAESPKALTIL